MSTLASPVRGLYAGDFAGDGHPDALVASDVDHQVVYIGASGAFEQRGPGFSLQH